MTTTTLDQTIVLVKFVLDEPIAGVRASLHHELTLIGSKEAQFYAGVIEHQNSLRLTADQWFDLNCKLPNRILRSGLDLRNILSEEQFRRLPPVTG